MDGLTRSARDAGAVRAPVTVLAWVPPVLATLVAVGATVAGALLVADPSGAAVGLSPALLAGTRFASYLVPGVLLFGVVGLFGLVAVVGLIAGRVWGWPAAAVHALAVIVWIGVQVGLLGSVSVLQPIVALAGAASLVALAHPAVARRYRAREGLALLVGV